jgi:hypothetical protein
MWSITPCYKYYLRYHTHSVCHLPYHLCCWISSAMSHSVFFVSSFKFWQLGSALVMQHITPGSRLNALGVFHRFSNPLSPSKQTCWESRCLVLGMLLGKTLIVCGWIGDNVMMIRIQIAWKSRCLVLGLLLGETLIVCGLNWEWIDDD